MHIDPFNPFNWILIPIGLYATACQYFIMGDSGTRDELGRRR